MGLSNTYLEKQGLVSIRALWIQIHYNKGDLLFLAESKHRKISPMPTADAIQYPQKPQIFSLTL
ncbi:MAG: hypothetical protein A2Z47_13720 [Thermodesulfovibrio sp. RBG_19FT_COMBO_42_12]|nr:MAG: hypothetical protein A2Z47_13720 [Thermodesulfovibrio sp. RBG_19FT_COMBO_42_12]